jgi:glycosyltransferase involved in cell wall biosynthesis
MKILIAMPAYNEAKYIGSLVVQARKHADRVLVVDDGSTDATAETARLAGAEVIRHETRTGKGTAVQSVFQAARESGVDVLVLMDADFQHLPEEIPLVLAPVTEGYDIAIGSRTAQARKTPRYRRLGQKVLTALAQTASRTAAHDSESGFRAFSRKAIETITLKEAGFAVEAEMLVQAHEHNLTVKEVPISNIYTGDGSTLHPVRHGLGVLNRVLWMISERRPLLFFGLFGGFFLLFGLALGVKVITEFYTDTGALATGTAMVTVLLITIGLLAIFTGLILNVLVNKLNSRL